MTECIIVPFSEADSFRKQVDNLSMEESTHIYKNYKMLVVPDEMYKRVQSAYKSGELDKIIKDGPAALEHWLNLGDNTIEEDTWSQGEWIDMQVEYDKWIHRKEKAVAKGEFEFAGKLRNYINDLQTKMNSKPQPTKWNPGITSD